MKDNHSAGQKNSFAKSDHVWNLFKCFNLLAIHWQKTQGMPHSQNTQRICKKTPKTQHTERKDILKNQLENLPTDLQSESSSNVLWLDKLY